MKVAADQVLFLGPGALPVWAAGLVYLLVCRRAAPYRMLAIAFLILFAALVGSRSSRPDRIAAFYPILFAAGGVVLEALTAGRRWVRVLLLALLLAGAGLALPITLPLLPPQTVAAYVEATGVLPRIERGKTSPIPQWLADRTGWEELVDDVAAVYHTLPPEDQARVVLLRAELWPGRGPRAAGSLPRPPGPSPLPPEQLLDVVQGSRRTAGAHRRRRQPQGPRRRICGARPRARPPLRILHELAQRRPDRRGAGPARPVARRLGDDEALRVTCRTVRRTPPLTARQETVQLRLRAGVR